MKRQELGVCLENSIPSFRAGGEVAGPCGGCVAAGRGDLPLDRVSWKLERQSFKERTSGGQPAASGWTTSSVSPGRKCIRGSSSPFIRRGVHGPNCQLSPTKDRCLQFPLDGAAGDRSTGCLPRPVTVFLGQLLGMRVSMRLSCLLSWDSEALFSLLSAPTRSNCGVHGLSLEKKLKSETLKK